MIKKMQKVGTAIKQRKGSFKERVRMINTYLIPCMGYLARFKLISKAVSSKMWKTIRSALGTYANLKSCVMTSLCPPFFEKPQVRHSILWKKKKKKNRGFKIQLSEFPIFCCSVYSCGWLPQKILWKPLHPV